MFSFSFLSNIGPEIPLTLLLLALLGFRFSVKPRASLFINAPASAIFKLIDVYDGKLDDWGRTTVRADLIDPATQTFRKTYTTTLSSGVPKSSNALFRLAERKADQSIILERVGLQGRSTNNELLKQIYEITPEANGSRLNITYEWGPRPLLAQVIARADLWGGVYRLKGMAETGKPNDQPYQLISAGIAAVTGLISLAAFSMVLTFTASLLLVLALFVHEFGHLLAYRLMGQPWGRMVFLPFLGAIALPRLPFESQGQAVFAALMGPGFSAILALACLLPEAFGVPHNPYVAVLGIVTVGLNIFNLLPVEPLDGGVALRSVLSRLMGKHARFGLMIVGALIVNIGFTMQQVVLIIFGSIAILANLRDRTIDVGLEPLTRLQIIISLFAYVAMITAYITLLRYFIDYAALLKNSMAVQ
jgi:Zn-dependent protease